MGHVSIIYTNIIQGTIQECNLLYVFLIPLLGLRKYSVTMLTQTQSGIYHILLKTILHCIMGMHVVFRFHHMGWDDMYIYAMTDCFYNFHNYNKRIAHIIRSKSKHIWLVNWIWQKKCFFFKNHAEYEAGRLVPDFFFFLKKKDLYEAKASGLELTFNIFW